MGNKNYIGCSLVEHPEIFRGYLNDKYSVSDEILSRLSRDLGFSFDMYNTILNIDNNTADKLVVSMSTKNNHKDIYFLVDEDTQDVLGYSLDSTRTPILNEVFIKRTKSLAETSNDIEIDDTYIISEDTMSSIILKKVDPIIVDLGSSQTSYDIGVLVVNNELDSVYCRLVIYIDNQPIYLPASYYNVTTNRYKKSTGTSEEALEVLLLKVIDDMREDELKYKLQDFHLKYRVNKDILVTYEEYHTLLRAMMKIPSIIVEDYSLIDSVKVREDDFEHKYAKLEDQKSSYIWRCTALGDLTIGGLVHLASKVLTDLNAPSMEYYNVRELLGNYLSTSRIASEIAREDL